MKTVDKFGRYRGYQNRAGPPGIGFHLNADGNYDMQDKILCNVGDPKSLKDGINRKYLQYKLGYLPKPNFHKKEFDCQEFRLAKVGMPSSIEDAATVRMVHDSIIIHEEWIQRELAELASFLIEKIYSAHRGDKAMVEKHVKDMEQKVDRTWRAVLKLDKKAEKFTKEEKANIRKKTEAWDHFLPANLSS